MGIRLFPHAELERHAHEEYRKKFKGAAQQDTQPANFGPVLELRDDVLLVYRGRAYRSPPVSYMDAVRLWELAVGMVALAQAETSADQIRSIAAFQRKVIRLAWSLCRPVDWRRFVPKSLLPNPFRKASPREVDALMDFFWKLQTRSSVRSGGRLDVLAN